MSREFEILLKSYDAAQMTIGHLNGEIARLRYSATACREEKDFIRKTVDDLLHHIAGGRKIDAIKAYRTLTGTGLKESKDVIEKTMTL